MGPQIIAGLCIVATFVLMARVARRYGPGDKPPTAGEIVMVAAIWGLTLGPILYLLPVSTESGTYASFWNPPVSVLDKVLLVILVLLGGLAVFRALTTKGPVRNMFLMVLLGIAMAYALALTLTAIFGQRAVD